MNNSANTSFATILLIVFIVLKLTGVITWSWWWVMAPLWVPIIFALVVFIAIRLYVK